MRSPVNISLFFLVLFCVERYHYPYKRLVSAKDRKHGSQEGVMVESVIREEYKSIEQWHSFSSLFMSGAERGSSRSADGRWPHSS